MNFLKGLLCACLIVIQACHYKNLKDQGEAENSPQSVQEIDFALVMSEVLRPRCIECHSPGGVAFFIPLQTYEQVKAEAIGIKVTIANDSMPKQRAPLTVAQKQMLNSWIDAGMPETSSAEAPKPLPPAVEPSPTPPPSVGPGPVPTPTPSPTPVNPAKDWLTVKTLVIDPACLRCHSAPVNRAGINVETYQNVLKDISLIESVIQDGSMPIRGSLMPEQKKLILEWIQDGAPEFAAP